MAKARATEAQLIQVSAETWTALSEAAIEDMEPAVAQKMSDRLWGSWSKWPCPFCPTRRMCKSKGWTQIDSADRPQMIDREADKEAASNQRARTIWDLIVDPIGNGLAWLTQRTLDDAMPPRGAREYACAEHGEFWIVFRPEFSPQHVWVARDGRLSRRLMRFTACFGLDETITSSGDRVKLRICGRIIEWVVEAKAEIGVVPGAYMCETHGRLAYDEEGNQMPRYVVNRLVQT